MPPSHSRLRVFEQPDRCPDSLRLSSVPERPPLRDALFQNRRSCQVREFFRSGSVTGVRTDHTVRTRTLQNCRYVREAETGDVNSKNAHTVSRARQVDGAKQTSPPGRRGRPRDDRIDERILEAGFIELAEGGISHFSVAAVARRAEVAKGTVYLRWPRRDDLILDSAARMVGRIGPAEATTIEEQLLELTDRWAADLARPRAVELLLRVDADRDKFPDLFEQIYENVQAVGNLVVERTLCEAEKRGEIKMPTTVRVLVRIFTGTLFAEALGHIPAGEIGPEFRRGLVDVLMAALRPSDH